MFRKGFSRKVQVWLFALVATERVASEIYAATFFATEEQRTKLLSVHYTGISFKLEFYSFTVKYYSQVKLYFTVSQKQ